MAETGPNVAEQPELTKRERLRLEEVAFLALVGLSIIGESVTNYSPIISFWYWLTMIPVFAMAAIIIDMNRYLQRRTAVRKSLYRLSHQPGALARPPSRDIGARSESVGAALVQ